VSPSITCRAAPPCAAAVLRETEGLGVAACGAVLAAVVRRGPGRPPPPRVTRVAGAGAMRGGGHGLQRCRPLHRPGLRARRRTAGRCDRDRNPSCCLPERARGGGRCVPRHRRPLCGRVPDGAVLHRERARLPAYGAPRVRRVPGPLSRPSGPSLSRRLRRGAGACGGWLWLRGGVASGRRSGAARAA